MPADFWTGFATGLSLIVAIGSQNAFVLRQGIRREHVLPLVLFCALSDALLIMGGIGGAGVVIHGNDMLLTVTRFGGALFLAGYGALAARRAWRGSQLHVKDDGGTTLLRALTICFGFTFLNPHVYLDTVVLLGALANQRPDPGRWTFGWGACAASLCWFSALGFGARLLGPVFEHVSAWRVLDSSIALVMFLMAGLLVAG
ncbi:MAG: LysE/ArgO family amino acid transporter [Rhodoferax sp.]|uniref:LysE/ArgO family amino acid transporter n=1 Tax=Rhodoferax sp. TaxID=50421 RepID=UPI00261E21DF|nr:LysE/ArgO family amino acid transporter [Rhodoferax sp.]MDD5334614.1 LysE/ArgO family amino acid transporter [Rhodoferax sp.]